MGAVRRGGGKALGAGGWSWCASACVCVALWLVARSLLAAHWPPCDPNKPNLLPLCARRFEKAVPGAAASGAGAEAVAALGVKVSALVEQYISGGCSAVLLHRCTACCSAAKSANRPASFPSPLPCSPLFTLPLLPRACSAGGPAHEGSPQDRNAGQQGGQRFLPGGSVDGRVVRE